MFFDPKRVTFCTPFLTPFWTTFFRSQSGHLHNVKSWSLESQDLGIPAQDMTFSAPENHSKNDTFCVTFLRVFSCTESVEVHACFHYKRQSPKIRHVVKAMKNHAPDMVIFRSKK